MPSCELQLRLRYTEAGSTVEVTFPDGTASNADQDGNFSVLVKRFEEGQPQSQIAKTPKQHIATTSNWAKVDDKDYSRFLCTS